MKHKCDTMINISFSCDDNFIPQLLVSLNSLLCNNPNLSFNIYVLDNFISQNNKRRIEDLINNFHSYVYFISMVDLNKIIEQYVDFDNISDLSLSTYSRLFLSSLIPNVDKILYLDCDSLIIGSIKELWETNIDNYMCAGVLDFMPLAYKEIIGLNEDDNYINAGVLLINLKLWREKHIEKDFIDFLEKHSNQFIHHDQGVINAVLRGNMLILPPKYNWINSLHGRNPAHVVKWFVNPVYYYDSEIIEESLNNLVFLHFCGGFGGRPWNNHNHYYFNLYKEYVHMAGVDEIEIYEFQDNRKLFSKIFGVLSNNSICLKVLNLIPDYCARIITNTILKIRLK